MQLELFCGSSGTSEGPAHQSWSFHSNLFHLVQEHILQITTEHSPKDFLLTPGKNKRSQYSGSGDCHHYFLFLPCFHCHYAYLPQKLQRSREIEYWLALSHKESQQPVPYGSRKLSYSKWYTELRYFPLNVLTNTIMLPGVCPFPFRMLHLSLIKNTINLRHSP